MRIIHCIIIILTILGLFCTAAPASASEEDDFFKDLETFQKPSAPDAEKIDTLKTSSDKNDSARLDALKKTPADRQINQEENGREWILKKDRLKKSEPAAAKKIKWKNKKQKKKCEALVEKLRRSFHETRYYSIQGDACATAAHAEKSIKLKDECKKNCPESFLESEGFHHRIIRNWDVLMRLGEVRCKE